MNIKTRKYIYRICIAVASLATVLGIVKQEIVTAVLPVVTAVLALADANVPDEETGDADAR
nr:MAG TPA: Mycobacterial 2 TMS Phage Holin (M2 Hol) Family [Caudoviricetes sp.]